MTTSNRVLKISVLIPTYQRSDDLPRLFASLTEQVEKPEEVIVVIGPGDTKSFEISKEWTTRLSGLKIYEAGKASVINSINLGFSKTETDIICLLDDDVSVPADWSVKIRKAYQDNEKLGAFGGRDYLQNGSSDLTNPPLANVVGKFTWSGHKGYHHCGSKESPILVDVIKGVNLSFRREAFPEMTIDKLLEDKGAETCWEMDLCLKVKQAGFDVVYDNNNYVLHYWSPRLGFDNRTDVFSPAWPKRIFNEAYIFTKYRPLIEFYIWSVRLFLIGTRVQPGLIWTVLLLHKSGYRVLKLPFRNLNYVVKGAIHGFRNRGAVP